MKCFSPSVFFQFQSSASALFAMQTFSIVAVAAVVLLISGCGSSEPPEIDPALQEKIAQEDEAIVDAESEL